MEKSFKDLFERMIERDPQKRITIEQILDHDWMHNGEILNSHLLAEELGKRISCLP